MASLYQKRLAARRRTGDITRLADQYKRSVESLAGEQEKAFAQYQTSVKEQMAPYEAQVSQYKQEFSVYESQAAAYNQRIADYQAMLDEFTANPYERIKPKSFEYGRGGGNFGAIIDGEKFTFAELERGGYKPVMSYYRPTAGKRIPVATGIESVLVPRKAPEPFSGEAPKAPTAPTPPKIAEFDASQFEARSAQLEGEYKRELGERRGARQRAISRGGARPLLQGAA